MGVFKEIWQRDQFLTVKLLDCLGWLEIIEAVTDSDSILYAAITYIRNLLVLIRNHGSGSDAWNTKTKRSRP